MSVDIALIGYGEVGRIFAADLLANGARSITAYDIRFDDAQDPLIGSAEAGGVAVARSAGEAFATAKVVVSAVTAAQTGAVAIQAASFMRRGQILLDINSASPATKRLAFERVTASGAGYVEGAVMAAVATPRLQVPILAGGPDAGTIAELLNPLGMKITPVSTKIGRASAMKLCRSIMIKGMEALIVDCAAAARTWNVSEDVFLSLSATFPSIDWSRLSIDMAERVNTHGVRRAAEMREAADMLREAGLVPDLALAVADRHETNAGRILGGVGAAAQSAGDAQDQTRSRGRATDSATSANNRRP